MGALLIGFGLFFMSPWTVYDLADAFAYLREQHKVKSAIRAEKRAVKQAEKAEREAIKEAQRLEEEAAFEAGIGSSKTSPHAGKEFDKDVDTEQVKFLKETRKLKNSPVHSG